MVFAESSKSWWDRAVLAIDWVAGASSRTTCAFVPPIPKELTPARRGVLPAGQDLNLSLTKKGELSKSMFGIDERPPPESFYPGFIFS